MSRTLAGLIVLWITLFGQGAALAEERFPSIDFSSQDRVLIVAPHPDDETIGTGGAIQKALKAGAEVKVVLMSNGENNELSFIVYKKRPVLTRRALLAMGEVRRSESSAALASLGLKEEDIVALGYPDFGMMEVMTKYWGNAKPFRSMLSRVRGVPYKDTLSPAAPYVGDSVLRDLKSVILAYKPTKIFVSHPADVNRDHRAAYLFLKVALWDLEGRLERPEVFPFLVHVVGWPKPGGYHPELGLPFPKELDHSSINWRRLELSSEEVGKKYTAIQKYVSQVKYAPTYLVTFARTEEYFGDYVPVRIHRQLTSEAEFTFVNPIDGIHEKLSGKRDNDISTLAYAWQGNDLVIQLTLKPDIENELGLHLTLLGYSRDVPFSQMPKISIEVGPAGLSIRDKNRRVSAKEIGFSSEGKVLTFRIPLSFLGSPQRLLSTARTFVNNLSIDEMAWRVLELE